jgi:hypothetical protein
MRVLQRYMAITLLWWTASMFIGQLAHAHLMVAQHGTLNIVDDGAFMVLPLPISAFEGVDDDNNGKISMLEFNNHRGAIVESVRQNVTLSDKQGTGSLQGILLSPVVPHDLTGEPISQLTVMGRFILNDTASALRFQIGLYGRQATEQVLEITATRNRDKQKTVFELTPAASASVIFPVSAQPQQKPVVWHL